MTICIWAAIHTSCVHSSPSGFWLDFNEKYQTNHINNQGPWGGIRVIHWKSEVEKFDKNQIIEFAKANGWLFKSDTTFKSYLTQTWLSNNKSIFPLYWKGFIPMPDNSIHSEFERFPRWISGNINVLSFNTNFISINLETQETILINGFIILNEQQSEMTLYHNWGE